MIMQCSECSKIHFELLTENTYHAFTARVYVGCSKSSRKNYIYERFVIVYEKNKRGVIKKFAVKFYRMYVIIYRNDVRGLQDININVNFIDIPNLGQSSDVNLNFITVHYLTSSQ